MVLKSHTWCDLGSLSLFAFASSNCCAGVGTDRHAFCRATCWQRAMVGWYLDIANSVKSSNCTFPIIDEGTFRANPFMFNPLTETLFWSLPLSWEIKWGQSYVNSFISWRPTAWVDLQPPTAKPNTRPASPLCWWQRRQHHVWEAGPLLPMALEDLSGEFRE